MESHIEMFLQMKCRCVSHDLYAQVNRLTMELECDTKGALRKVSDIPRDVSFGQNLLQSLAGSSKFWGYDQLSCHPAF